jgi:hypothetical protein
MTAILLPSVVYRGLDTVQAVTPVQAAMVADAGYVWAGRYMPHDDRRLEKPHPTGDHLGCWTLSKHEADIWLDADIMPLPVQWGPSRGDDIGSELGRARGAAIADYARWLGIDEGTHLWCDVEGGVLVRAGKVRTIAYIVAWADAVLQRGYLAGVYFSRPLPLSGADLYRLAGVTSYWGAAQALETPWPRDCSIRQFHLRAMRHPNPDKAARCEDARRPCPIVYGRPLEAHAKPVCPLDGTRECFVPMGLSYDPDVMRPDCFNEMPVLWAA